MKDEFSPESALTLPTTLLTPVRPSKPTQVCLTHSPDSRCHSSCCGCSPNTQRQNPSFLGLDTKSMRLWAECQAACLICGSLQELLRSLRRARHLGEHADRVPIRTGDWRTPVTQSECSVSHWQDVCSTPPPPEYLRQAVRMFAERGPDLFEFIKLGLGKAKFSVIWTANTCFYIKSVFFTYTHVHKHLSQHPVTSATC